MLPFCGPAATGNRGLDDVRYGASSVAARLIQRRLHMRAKTPGTFYRVNYQFAAASVRKKKQKTLSPLGDAVISNLCPIMLGSEGVARVCVRVCARRLIGRGGEEEDTEYWGYNQK